MEMVTALLFVAALLSYAMSFKVQSRVLSTFVIVLSVCGLSAVFQDASVGDEITYLVAFPLIATTLFAIADICVIKEDKN